MLAGSLPTAAAQVAPPAPDDPGTSTSSAVGRRSASADATARRSSPPPRTFLVAMGGDILNENAVNAAGAAAAGPGERYDFAPVFAPVAEVISAADLAICHAELPIGAPGERPGQYGRSPYGGNRLLAPYELAQGLADTGFDRCSTASNHSFDTGVPGIVSTLDAFDRAGMSHAGTARNEAEAVPDVFVVDGIRVAHLSYTRSWNTDRPRDRWMVSGVASVEQVAADVEAVRARGAEVVIVSIHVGTEMLSAPTSGDRTFATDLVAAARIDLLVHHGPHVVQPVERVNGTLVYWSLGNFVSGMGTAGSGRYADLRTLDGLLATVRFTETSPGRFVTESQPVLVCTSRIDRSVHPAVSAMTDRATLAAMSPARQRELLECIARTHDVVPSIF
jgi:poly-gamma-glutamate synthesis protein (capsule biosynthesis protein)